MTTIDNSNVAEDVYNRASAVPAGGLNRDVKRSAEVVGYRAMVTDPRLVRFDRSGARMDTPVPWSATKDDRMSAVEAGDMMEKLYEAYNLKGAAPNVLEAFHCALYFAHTINGSSSLQPGRATITVANNEMPYSVATTYLGNENRRFFRTYADEVRTNNKRVLEAAKATGNVVAQEAAAFLRGVADARGLGRYPDLAHDTADACWSLNDAERTALAHSKTLIFGTTPNMADRARYRAGQSDSPGSGSMYDTPTARHNVLAAH